MEKNILHIQITYDIINYLSYIVHFFLKKKITVYYYIVHIFIYMNSQTILKRIQLNCHEKKKPISEPKVQDLHSFNVKVKTGSFVYFPKAIKLFHIYDCTTSDRQKLYLTFYKR